MHVVFSLKTDHFLLSILVAFARVVDLASFYFFSSTCLIVIRCRLLKRAYTRHAGSGKKRRKRENYVFGEHITRGFMGRKHEIQKAERENASKFRFRGAEEFDFAVSNVRRMWQTSTEISLS